MKTSILVVLLTSLVLGTAHASIEPTSGRYVHTQTDLSIQVLGGQVRWQREWRDNRWHFNRPWSDLRIEYDVTDGNIRRILRDNDTYERIDSAGTRFGFGPRMRIRTTEHGLRWTDREGGWIDYSAQGKILGYGDRNGITVTFVRDGEGRIQQVLDHHGEIVLTLIYEDDELRSVADHGGREVHYQYTNGQLTTVTDVRGHDWEYSYSGDRLTGQTDPRGHTTTISYTPDGRVHQIERPGQGAIQYTFDYLNAQRHYYLRTTRPGGEVIEAWYHRNGDLLRRDVNGRTVLRVQRDGRRRIHFDFNNRPTIHHYDEFRNPTGITWPDGASQVTEYDYTIFQIRRHVDETGVITRHEYDGQGNRTRTIEAAGTTLERTTEYDYDQYGQITAIRRLGDTDTETAVTTFDYDSWGNVIQITDPEGAVETYTHDVMGNVLTRTDAHEAVWTYEYDPAGHLTRQINPLQHEVSYHYDEGGNRTKITHADQSETLFEYDAANRLVKQIDTLGGEQTYEYDQAGNRIRETDPSGKVTEYAYDSSRRMTAMTDGAGNATVFHYPDAPGHQTGDRHQPISIQYPTFERQLRYDTRGRMIIQIDRWQEDSQWRERTTRNFYDARGQEITSRDPAGRETAYAYDALGRLTATTDALDQVTQYHYDNRDNLIGLTDANGNTHSFTFDRTNRMLTEARPMGQTIHYSYDAAGRMTARTDPVGHRAEYDYDPIGRRTALRHYHADDLQTPDKVVTFDYDVRSRLLGYDDGYTSADYSYDGLGRKTAETVTYPGFTQTHQQTWHANGRQQSLTAPHGATYTFSWDSADRLQAVLIPGEGVIQYADYQWHQPTTVHFPGGSVRQQSFDGLQRHQAIQVQSPGGQTLMDYTYTWDETGNITEKVTEHGPYEYSYDDIDRLVEAEYPSFSAEEWSYDPLGNRITDARTGEHEWAYNDNNELLDSIEYSYEYDANGSLIAEYHPGGAIYRTFEYNSENRMSAVRNSTGQLIAEYYYDPFGRRIQKTVYNPPGATEPETVWYAYSDQGLMSELDGQGDHQDFYLFPPGGLWSTDPILRRSGSSYYYYQTDHLGTPQQLIDQVGNVMHSREMRAFGEVVQDGMEDRWRFPGQLESGETGLYYNYWRDYRPQLGRYVQSDPLGLLGSNNYYAYASNVPISRIDPLGLKDFVCCAEDDLSDGECCAQFEWTGQAGRIFCCGTRLMTCLNPNMPPLPNDRANRIVTNCVMEHENRHRNHVGGCDECGIYNPPFADGWDQPTAECDAYKIEIACLSRRRRRCDGEVSCESYIDRVKKEAEDEKERYCS